MNHRRPHARRAPHRNPESAVPPNFVEVLEKRVLLASVGAFRPPAPFTPSSTDVADVKNGPMANAGAALIEIYREYRKFQRSGGTDSSFKSKSSDKYLLSGGRAGVTVRGRGTLEELTNRLRDSRAEILMRNRRFTVIEAMVPIGQLHELARDPKIATLTPMYLPERRQQGVSDNQADFVMKTDRVRDLFGLDGRGVNVGILSDSINLTGFGLAGSIATGDLPTNVTVIAEQGLISQLVQPPTDEGRAMAELIHDIAPASPLFFATAFGGQLIFADNIRALRRAGAEILVDDVGYPNEPYFQPGVIDQAITDVTADGAVYFAAAGNNGDAGLELTLDGFVRQGRNRLADFDPGPGVDTRLRLEGAGAGLLQWDEPYNGIVGAAQNDLDFYFFDANTGKFVGSFNENNLRTGVPGEFVGFFGEVEMEIRLADFIAGAPLPTRFRVVGINVTESEYEPVSRATILGHGGGFDAISVGAAPFNFPVQNEDFSSHGPVTYLFDANGNRFPDPIFLQKPDITGVDNVNTSFFGASTRVSNFSDPDPDALPNFTGTSAAAPNVAALAALIRQAAPFASSAEIADALRSTALPLNGPEFGYDTQGGFGLVDGEAAIQQFIQQPTVDVPRVSPNPRVDPLDSIKIVFSQVVLNFDLSDLTLTRDGGPNLLTSTQTLQPTDSGRTWMLRELRNITRTPGTYTLTLDATSSDIINTTIFAQTLANGFNFSFTVIPFPPAPATPSNLKAKVVEQAVRLRWSDNSDNEDRFVLQRSDDAQFLTGLRTFNLPAGSTVFTDTTLAPSAGRRVFYRIRAVNDFSTFLGYSNSVEVFLPGPGEIVLDSENSKAVQITGVWQSVSATPGFLGESALEDLNADKGEKEVRFTPRIGRTTDYFVYARWTRAENRATNVPVDVVFANRRKKTVIIDQRNTGGDGWVLLGKFRLEAGTGGYVRFRTDGTNGVVAVDAMRFQPVDGSG